MGSGMDLSIGIEVIATTCLSHFPARAGFHASHCLLIKMISGK